MPPGWERKGNARALSGAIRRHLRESSSKQSFKVGKLDGGNERGEGWGKGGIEWEALSEGASDSIRVTKGNETSPKSESGNFYARQLCFGSGSEGGREATRVEVITASRLSRCHRGIARFSQIFHSSPTPINKSRTEMRYLFCMGFVATSRQAKRVVCLPEDRGNHF